MSSIILARRAAAALPESEADRRCNTVNALRDAKLASGYADATTGKTWSCDPESIGKWTAIGSSAGMALLMSQAVTFELIPADNTTLELAAADAFALFNGRVMPWVSSTFIFARDLKNTILAAEDPMGVDIETGWPS